MRRLLGAVVITAATLACVACGSSEPEKPAPPAAAKPDKAKPAAMAEPAEVTEAQKQELLGLMVWAGAGQAGDKQADALACHEQNEKDPSLQKGVHGLVVVQRWIKCMEGLGWERKKQG